MAEGALRHQLLHQPLEGNVLVLLGLHHGGAGPRQQLAPGGVAGEVGPQHQRVHQEADQPLQLRPAAVRHRGPHQHVVLPRPARQQRLPPGQERREERRALRARQRPERRGGLGPEGERARPGLPGREVGPGAVRRQLQERGSAPQPFAPVGELRLQRLPGEGAALPHGVVGVLDGEVGERGRLPAGEGVVQGGDLAHQHTRAPPVADDVVQREQRHRLVRARAEEPRAQERPARQVERPGRLRAHLPADRLLALLRGERGKVGDLDGDRGRLADGLHRLAVDLREHRAQRLVPAHDLAERPLQRAQLQRAPQAERDGDVVGGASRLQPVRQPEALLREGEGEAVPAGRAPREDGVRLRRRSQPLVLQQEREEPELFRRQLQRIRGVVRVHAPSAVVLDATGRRVVGVRNAGVPRPRIGPGRSCLWFVSLCGRRHGSDPSVPIRVAFHAAGLLRPRRRHEDRDRSSADSFGPAGEIS